MVSPIRYPSGVSTADKYSSLYNYPHPDPTKVYSYFNDFNAYAAADWTITRVGTTPTEALQNGSFGELLITNSSASGDSDQLQLKAQTVNILAGKKTWFKARFKTSDATQSNFLIGLSVLNTTLLSAANGTGTTDGIFFNKDAGDTQLDFQCQKDASTGQVRAANIATWDTNYHTVGFEFDGVREVKYFFDGVVLGHLDLWTGPNKVLTDYIPDAGLTFSFALKNGDANARTMTVDYIFAAVER